MLSFQSRVRRVRHFLAWNKAVF